MDSVTVKITTEDGTVLHPGNVKVGDYGVTFDMPKEMEENPGQEYVINIWWGSDDG